MNNYGYMNQYGAPNMQQTNPYLYNLPHYEVIKVHGREGANAFQMGPNSSIILADDTNPIVWFVQTDGAGYKTVSPFKIVPEQEEQTIDIPSLMTRMDQLEAELASLKEVRYGKSNSRPNGKRQQPAEQPNTSN